MIDPPSNTLENHVVTERVLHPPQPFPPSPPEDKWWLVPNNHFCAAKANYVAACHKWNIFYSFQSITLQHSWAENLSALKEAQEGKFDYDYDEKSLTNFC